MNKVPRRGWVVVSGANGGIGQATVAALLASGHDVVALVRNPADCTLPVQAGPRRCCVMACDVTEAESIRRLRSDLETLLAGELLYGLVNNAGIAVGGAWEDLDPAELRRQLDVNLFGVLALVQALLPLLGGVWPPPAERRGRIVNISSVSGAIAYPYLGPYAVSKFALEAFSESLRRELMVYGLDVIVVAPGNVATPIWDKAEANPPALSPCPAHRRAMERVLEHAVTSGRRGMPSQKVARVIVRALDARWPKARYSPVQSRLVSWILPRLLPRRFFDRLVAASLGIRRPPRPGADRS